MSIRALFPRDERWGVGHTIQKYLSKKLFLHCHNINIHACRLLTCMILSSILQKVSTMGLWLRIIQINDVYELDNFPNLSTLIQQHSTQRSGPESDSENAAPDKTLVVCAGDFLAPSLLSSLDKGAGMVDCLEAVGVTHVCLGNHETDVGDQALKERIMTSKLAWINTNVPTLNDILGVDTIPHDKIEVSNGTTTKKVGVLGLLTHDPSLYRPNSFGGATIESIIPFTTKRTLPSSNRKWMSM
jgi:2',3'-cyclic-nucleotide 2'-phosphodiesterase (5'-nucleotidase family)